MYLVGSYLQRLSFKVSLILLLSPRHTRHTSTSFILLREDRWEEILLFLLLSLEVFVFFFELITMLLASDLAAINQVSVKEQKVYIF